MTGRPPSAVVAITPSRIGRGDVPCTTVLHVAGDQDALVAMAPVIAALEPRRAVRQVVVQAGAGAGEDHAMLPAADRGLDLEALEGAECLAAALVAVDAILLQERPDVVVVAGEDEVSMAAALAAAKRSISVAHLGAGLRSWDWTLPEEVHRSVIDRVADSLFVISEDAVANLEGEGIPDGRVHLVGNTRIDLLRRFEAKARAHAAWKAFGAAEGAYVLVSLRRAETVAPPEGLERLATALADLAVGTPVVLLLDPRTRSAFEAGAAGAFLAAGGVQCAEPAGYLDALSLLAGAGAIITDTGAVQEESSALGISCYTLLPTTARTVTLTHGTNVLLGDDPAAILGVQPSPWSPTPAAIPLWDGRAGERVAEALVTNYTLAAADAGER